MLGDTLPNFIAPGKQSMFARISGPDSFSAATKANKVSENPLSIRRAEASEIVAPTRPQKIQCLTLLIYEPLSSFSHL